MTSKRASGRSPGHPRTANRHKGIIMLRSIGSVTVLALLMVGCGGGGGDSGSPPPPPSYTVGGTVSGLAGSGLALAICRFLSSSVKRLRVCDSPLQVSASGAFSLGGVYPAVYS